MSNASYRYRSSFRQEIRRLQAWLSVTTPQVKTLAVTSPCVGDGKSTIVARLARTVAQSGSRVAILDCDSLRPSIAEAFELPSLPVVFPRAEAAVVSPVLKDGVALYAAGVDLGGVGKERLQEVLSDLSASVDLLILDCPPVLIDGNALVASAASDATIVVVREMSTRKDAAADAADALKQAGARVLGVVYNGVKR